MSDVVKVATIIASAVKIGVETAKALGLEIPGIDKAADFERALNEQAAKLMPHELTALALLVNALSVKVDMQVAKLGDAPTCPKCQNVATQHISKSVSGPAEVSLSCSSCGWKS